MKTGIELIAEERREQIEKHGRTVELDKSVNTSEQLIHAAMNLCDPFSPKPGTPDYEQWVFDIVGQGTPEGWDRYQFEKMVRKPFKERLIIAGALIAARIDCLP